MAKKRVVYGSNRLEFPTLEKFKEGIHRAAERAKERRQIQRIAKNERKELLVGDEETL